MKLRKLKVFEDKDVKTQYYQQFKFNKNCNIWRNKYNSNSPFYGSECDGTTSCNITVLKKILNKFG